MRDSINGSLFFVFTSLEIQTMFIFVGRNILEVTETMSSERETKNVVLSHFYSLFEVRIVSYG